MKKIFYKWKHVEGACLEVARQMSDHNWRPDYIVGITRGGLIPANLLSQYTGIKMHTLNVSLRDGDGGESNLWMAEDAIGAVPSDRSAEFGGHKHVEKLKKKILIVDDINDSGATLNWIMEDWRSSCLPKAVDWDYVFNNNVRFAVIVDNLASKCDVKMDYVGMEVNKAEKDVWIEFPYEEWWTK